MRGGEGRLFVFRNIGNFPGMLLVKNRRERKVISKVCIVSREINQALPASLLFPGSQLGKLY